MTYKSLSIVEDAQLILSLSFSCDLMFYHGLCAITVMNSHTLDALCCQVMEKMFEIPVDYWESYLNVDEENIYPNQYNTPQTPDGASKYLIYT